MATEKEEWTVQTLKLYVDALLAERDKKYSEQHAASALESKNEITYLREIIQSNLTASNTAVLKAETANEKRFDSVNEFRSQLGDILASTMPRAETEQRINAVTEKAEVAIKANTDKVDNLTNRINVGDGRFKGIGDSWGVLIGIAGIATAVATIIYYSHH